MLYGGYKGLMKKKNIFAVGIGHITACMTPVIPIIVAGGLLKLVVLLLGYTPLFSIFPDTKTILDAIGTAPLYFLPVLVAYSSAVHYETDRICATAVGASMLMPEFISLMQTDKAVSFVGIPVFHMSYAYSVFPIIVMIYIMSVLDKKLLGKMKGTVRSLFYYLTLYVTTTLIGILAIGPLIGTISQALLNMILYFQKVAPVFAWILFDATVPFQVITGTHWVFISFVLSELGNHGVECGFMMGYFALAMDLTAISLVALKKSSDAKTKNLALTSLISIFFTGTSEPALFGLCLNSPTALVAIVIAGACTGLYQGIVTINNYAYAFPTLFTSLTFQSDTDPTNFSQALIAAAISFVVSLVIMILFYRKKNDKNG